MGDAYDTLAEVEESDWIGELLAAEPSEASHGFFREGNPVNVYPFIDAEKRQSSQDGVRGGKVKRSCELLGVSRSA